MDATQRKCKNCWATLDGPKRREYCSWECRQLGRRRSLRLRREYHQARKTWEASR